MARHASTFRSRHLLAALRMAPPCRPAIEKASAARRFFAGRPAAGLAARSKTLRKRKRFAAPGPCRLRRSARSALCLGAARHRHTERDAGGFSRSLAKPVVQHDGLSAAGRRQPGAPTASEQNRSGIRRGFPRDVKGETAAIEQIADRTKCRQRSCRRRRRHRPARQRTAVERKRSQRTTFSARHVFCGRAPPSCSSMPSARPPARSSKAGKKKSWGRRFSAGDAESRRDQLQPVCRRRLLTAASDSVVYSARLVSADRMALPKSYARTRLAGNALLDMRNEGTGRKDQ